MGTGSLRAWVVGAVVCGGLGVYLWIRQPGLHLLDTPQPPSSSARVDGALARGDFDEALRAAADASAADPWSPLLVWHVAFARGERGAALAAYRAAARFGAMPPAWLVADLRAAFDDSALTETAFSVAESFGAPAERLLSELAVTTRSAAIKRRAADAIERIAAQGDSR